jgi:hypothetical protein
MYWVYLASPISTGTTTAFVAGPMTHAQFVSRYGDPYGNSNGYPTKLQAAAAAGRYNSKPASQRETPGSKPFAPNALTGPGGLPKLANPLGGINAIGDFFNRLTQPNTWIRVGEAVAGLLLVYLGLSAVMRGTEAQRQVTKVRSTAKKVAAVAAK